MNVNIIGWICQGLLSGIRGKETGVRIQGSGDAGEDAGDRISIYIIYYKGYVSGYI